MHDDKQTNFEDSEEPELTRIIHKKTHIWGAKVLFLG